MVNHCVVWGCNFKYSTRWKNSKTTVSLHKFPDQKNQGYLRAAWIKAIRRANWKPSKYSAVCSQHFRKEDMNYTGRTRRLRENAVPSIFPSFPKDLQNKIKVSKQTITTKKMSITDKSKSSVNSESLIKKEVYNDNCVNNFSTKMLQSSLENHNCITRHTKIPLNVFAFRLKPGTEIKSFLHHFVKENKLKSAFIITCCGSVSEAKLRYATRKDNSHKIEHLKKYFEITSLVGTICKDGSHLHITLGTEDGTTVSGHVVGDLIVHTTAEIVLGEAPDINFSRKFDPNTGFSELVML